VKIPIIISKNILELDSFFLGGGEVDTKLFVKTQEWMQSMKPFVADVIAEGKEASGDDDDIDFDEQAAE
jgi:hypothetical protein